MREPFRIGEKVAVYDNGRRMIGIIGLVPQGLKIRVDGVQSQDCATWTFGWFHPKQLRRIVKRKAREWEGHWDLAEAFKDDAIVFCPYSGTADGMDGHIGRVREVLPKRGKP